MYEIRNSSGHPPDQISMSCNAFLREIFPVTALAQLMASSLHRGRRLLPQIILVLPCVLVLASYCLGDIPGVNYVNSICVAGNYTSNSTFQDNLGLLLSSLNSTTPLTGFSNATIGLDSDKVYGLAMCRGDVTPNLCRNCLAAATASVGQQCPFRKAATVWYELCHLRYSNASFIGSPDTDYVKQFSTKIETDPEVFNRIRGNVLNVLTSRAESSPHMFAANQEKVSNSSSIYAMVQCTRDLDPKECNSCLTTMIEIIPTCCSDIKGAKLLAESCWLRYEDFSFFYNASALEDPLAPPPSSIQAPSPGGGSPTAIDAAGKSKDKGSLKIIVAITVPLVLTFVALILSAAVCICVRRSKTKTKILGSTAGEAIGKFESLLFNLETLRLATENFSESNKLGEGGFGAVYKGVLPNDQRIAVKRLSKGSAQGKGELRTEVDLVARLQHRNLVRLLGWCLEDQEMLLVYEYLPNKSLDRFLFDPGKSKLLNWERRVKIIEGVARGLLYLHEDSRLKVVHRDLKASNVLLDEDMDLKIADFGFARLLGDEQSLGNTRRPAGTLSAACPSGYMAPEHQMYGKISTKCDVYAFGVLLLEIVTGRKCIGFHGTNPPTDLLGFVWGRWNEGDAQALVDTNAGGGCSREEVLRYVHTGLLCVHNDPQSRPTMSSVVVILSSPSATLPGLSDPIAFFGYERTGSSSLGDEQHAPDQSYDNNAERKAAGNDVVSEETSMLTRR